MLKVACEKVQLKKIVENWQVEGIVVSVNVFNKILTFKILANLL